MMLDEYTHSHQLGKASQGCSLSGPEVLFGAVRWRSLLVVDDARFGCIDPSDGALRDNLERPNY
jgi:hypothetical protein